MAGSIFTVFNSGQLLTELPELGLVLSDWILLGLGVAVVWLVDWKREPLQRRFLGFSPAVRTGAVCLLALAVLVFGMYGIGFDASAFIYGGF
jgi:hypothetical protein